ncbi:unnamed protein product [Heterotrigona itama]|uniref:Uncharacterized protein n=1 Tax=Heterotrigona itama TaxID=395501 RepID=A0A6V7HJ31_9HYME|nr:unnamed protein product [Heterotrigona itama]
MDIINPAIQTNNRFSLFAEWHAIEQEKSNRNNESLKGNTSISNKNATVTKQQNTKLLPVYAHINHAKLLDALREKYNNAFQIKFTSNKLQIMFANLNDFAEFKTICQKENIECHTYTVRLEKTTTVYQKSRIKPHTKYLIYRITFAPGTIIAQINHIRSIISKLTGKNLSRTDLPYNVLDVKLTDTLQQTATRKQSASSVQDYMIPELALRHLKYLLPVLTARKPPS